MNKTLVIAVVVLVVGSVSIYALSPYFTESTIDEALPINSISSSKVEKEDSISQQKTTMEKSTIETVTPTRYEGTFEGVGDGIHDAEGDVFTVPLEDGNNVLRLENFKSTNGPDLYVYLSTDEQASEFINLGLLKANRGNQNYEIPPEADLTKYNHVLIWCKSFGVLFGSAELSP